MPIGISKKCALRTLMSALTPPTAVLILMNLKPACPTSFKANSTARSGAPLTDELHVNAVLGLLPSPHISQSGIFASFPVISTERHFDCGFGVGIVGKDRIHRRQMIGDATRPTKFGARIELLDRGDAGMLASPVHWCSGEASTIILYAFVRPHGGVIVRGRRQGRVRRDDTGLGLNGNCLDGDNFHDGSYRAMPPFATAAASFGVGGDRYLALAGHGDVPAGVEELLVVADHAAEDVGIDQHAATRHDRAAIAVISPADLADPVRLVMARFGS